jgi:hypothetical protein
MFQHKRSQLTLPEAEMQTSDDVRVNMSTNRKDPDDIGPNDVVETLENQSDPVLKKKMTLMSEAIEQIGMTPFHWKLFVLTGFGYAVDSVRLDSSTLLASQ